MDGSSSLAHRIGVSDLVIGLTIVSIGTSAPELLVNIVASLEGASDVGIGNVLGSNIANILLILGISSIIYPLFIKKTTTWKEIPLNLMSGLILLGLVNDVYLDGSSSSMLTRSDGILLMGYFVIFIYYTVGLAKETNGEDHRVPQHGILKSILMVVGGIAALAVGGQWVVDGAIAVASGIGVSEALIGLTIVAVGTSLPELATSAVAAYKHNTDIAVGNVVGSNIFNLFWVLGISALIRPLPFRTELNVDILVYIAATLLLFGCVFTGKKSHLDRSQGIFFIAAYVAYIIFLVYRG